MSDSDHIFTSLCRHVSIKICRNWWWTRSGRTSSGAIAASATCSLNTRRVHVCTRCSSGTQCSRVRSSWTSAPVRYELPFLCFCDAPLDYTVLYTSIRFCCARSCSTCVPIECVYSSRNVYRSNSMRVAQADSGYCALRSTLNTKLYYALFSFI